MRKTVLLAIVFTYTGVVLQAQTKPVAKQAAQTKQSLKKVLELKMPKTEDDDMAGKRGASVAWHSVQKKYYAVFAGNAEYPLAIFDMTGKLLSDEDQTAMTDTRGL